MITIFEYMDNFVNSNVFFKDSSEVREIEEKTDMEFEVRYIIDVTNLDKRDCQRMERCEIKKIFIAFALLDKEYEFVRNKMTYNLSGNKN